MTGRVANILLAICLAAVLALPQATAALSALGMSDARVMVICTGDGLRTITLDEDRHPVDVSAEAELCALVNAMDTSQPAVVQVEHRSRFYTERASLRDEPCPLFPACGLSYPRAPPAV